jgi:hypothetical protein
VTARAAAPGGASASDAGATTVVVRHAPRPLPTIADLRARRRGDRVIVTWRTAAPAPHVRFFLLASRTRRTSTAVAGRSIPAGSRTRHRAVLGPDDRFPFGSGSGPAHWVTLSVEADDRIGEHGATVARIR